MNNENSTSGGDKSRTWSGYQEAIFESVASGTGHLFVRARAGTGKTTTIVEALRHVPKNKSALLVAFNKSIANELKTRAPAGVDVSTLHAFGLRAITSGLGRVRIEGDKVRDHLGAVYPDRDDVPFVQAVTKTVSLAKATLARTREEIVDTIDAFGILDTAEDGVTLDNVVRVAIETLTWCENPDGVIDFDDMIWLPVVKKLNLKKFDFVFVDEAQDLNACQMELITRCRGGRVVCVGDDRQAIYQFRGADEAAVETLVARFEMKVLPLSITYRCARLIVAEARRFVPDYEASPTAPEGVVRGTSVDQAKKEFQPGDFVLSRTNAPLVSLCLQMIASGRRAKIQGRDLGTNLSALVRKMHAQGVDGLKDKIDAWRRRECERLEKRGKDSSAVTDKADCVLALAEGARTVPEVIAKIESLFNDLDDTNAVTLSSTHKAKGLERDRVFMLIDTYRAGKSREEDNLVYVATTRARHELVYVTTKGGAS